MEAASGDGMKVTDDGGTRVLVVDDDVPLAQALRRVLSHMGLRVEVANDGETALQRIEESEFDVMVLDLRMRGMDGLSVLRAARRSPNAPATILHSAFLDVPTTVTAMREGVSDVMEKPVAAQVLADRIRELAEQARSASPEFRQAERRLPSAEPPGAIERLRGDSTAVQELREQIRKIAAFREVSVLVEGATGTGKELVARAVHDLGSNDDPFVTLNCAAVPENLFESELFGHEAGALTSARGQRVGLLEEAAAGTLFLDEVGEIPISLQPKLLRALETREFRRVGSDRIRRFEARVVSSTNRSLTDQGAGFRPDLYFRLAGYTIYTPTLVERADDVPPLSRAFLASFSERYHGAPMTLADGAVEALMRYHWPGNVRELRAVVENAAIMARGGAVERADIETALRSRRGEAAAAGEGVTVADFVQPRSSGVRVVTPSSSGERTSLPQLERSLILRAYADAGENLSRAARALGIPRSTLRDRLRKFGVR